MQFTFFIPLWVILSCIIIASSITIYGYIIIAQPIQRVVRNLLIALRIVAIAVLLCCLLAPVVIEKKDITPPTHLSILVDSSQSMQMEDNYQGKTDISRFDQVRQLLFSDANEFLNTLNSQYKVHIYNFDSMLYKNTAMDNSSKPTGFLTDIDLSTREVVEIWKGQPNAGIVLITDGGHNASSFSTNELALLQVPVYALGVGSPKRPKDILIQNIEVLPIVYTGHECVIRIQVAQKGYNNESIRVSLRESGSNRLIDATILSFPKDNGEQSSIVDASGIADETQHYIELKMTPDKEGNFQYKVVLPTLEDELTSANNEKTFSLKVIKAKLNVFYYEGRPRWEYAFLKRTLERDPDINATFAVRSIKTNTETVLNQNRGYYPQEPGIESNQFPTTPEELNKFDILILGDITFGHLQSTQQQAIKDFVEKHGKAVIFLPSHNAFGENGFNKTRFASILPIQIPERGCSEQKREFAVELTQAGLFHPMLQIDDDFERNIDIWQELPALTNSFRDFQLRAGATTLLKKQDGQPVLLFQRVGLGKSLLFAAEGIWNWGFGVNAFKDTIYLTVYQQFWAQVLRWMEQDSDENKVYISTNASTYLQGEEVEINVRTFSNTFKPQENSEVQITVTSPRDSTFSLRTRTKGDDSQSDSASSYNAKFKAEDTGIYKIHAVGKSGNINIGEDEIDIAVQPQLVELESPQLNEALLRQITEQTGGVYLNIEEAHMLPEKISKVENSVFVDTKRDLWAHPLLLIFIVGLLGSEWFVRKRMGLV